MGAKEGFFMYEKVIKVGLAGFGMIGGRFHAPCLAAHPGYELTAIYQRKGNEAAQRFPDTKIVRRYEELLESDVDVIVLAVPNSLHVSMARSALEARKDLVVEKPLALTAAEGEALFNLAEEKGRLLAVFQNRRYDGAFLAARELVETGTLGEVLEWETTYDRWMPGLWTALDKDWREEDREGGVLYDLGSHLVDEVVSFFGPPQALWADLRTQREGSRVVDDIYLRLFYPGLRATVKAASLAADEGERPRRTVLGRRGAFTVWGREDAGQTGHLTLVGPGGSERVELSIPPNAHTRFYDDLYETLVHKKPFPVTKEQAVAVLRVLEGASESVRTGEKIMLK